MYKRKRVVDNISYVTYYQYKNVNPDRAKLPIGFLLAIVFLAGTTAGYGQTAPRAGVADRGSRTAKAGFRNENEIRDKFNNWKMDEDARAWLAAMNYKVGDIESVIATKPHGGKADVEVRIFLKKNLPHSLKGAMQTERREGISIKLVSSRNGFNQIDKRWVATYAKMWKMPADVVTALKLFVGETPPRAGSRDYKRMFFNELDPSQQKAVMDFFTANRDEIVSDLFAGDGVHDADWVMVALKAADKPRWIIRSSADTIKYFGSGPVEITRNGNLKVGRITMQRKGGDAGRETAKMLQFKINPVQLFDAK